MDTTRPSTLQEGLAVEPLRADKTTGSQAQVKFEPLEVESAAPDAPVAAYESYSCWFRLYQRTLRVRFVFFLLVCSVLTSSVVCGVLIQACFRAFAEMYQEHLSATWASHQQEVATNEAVVPFLFLPLYILGGALLMQQFWHLLIDMHGKLFLTHFFAIALCIIAHRCKMTIFRQLCIALDAMLMLALEVWPLLNALAALLGVDYGVDAPFLTQMMCQNYLVAVLFSYNMLAIVLFAMKVVLVSHGISDSYVSNIEGVLSSRSVYPGTLRWHYRSLGDSLYLKEMLILQKESAGELARQERLASLNCWHLLAFVGSASSSWMWGFPWPLILDRALVGGCAAIMCVHVALADGSAEPSSVTNPLLVWLAVSLGLTIALQSGLSDTHDQRGGFAFVVFLALWPAMCLFDSFRRRYFSPERVPVKDYADLVPVHVRLRCFCGVGALSGGCAFHMFQSWRVTLIGAIVFAAMVRSFHNNALSNKSVFLFMLLLIWLLSCGHMFERFSTGFLIAVIPSLVVGGSVICCMRRSLQVPGFITLLFIIVLIFGFWPLHLIGKDPTAELPSKGEMTAEQQAIQLRWINKKTTISAIEFFPALILILALASHSINTHAPQLIGRMFWFSQGFFFLTFSTLSLSSPQLTLRGGQLIPLMRDVEDILAPDSLPREWNGVPRSQQYSVCQQTWGAEGSALHAIDLAALAWAAYEEDMSSLLTLLQVQFGGIFLNDSVKNLVFTLHGQNRSVHEWSATKWGRLPRFVNVHFRPEDQSTYDRSTIVIAVKGSSTTADILLDTDLYSMVQILQFMDVVSPVTGLMPVPFLQALMFFGSSKKLESKIWRDLEEYVQDALRQYPFADIVLTGHSLGGMLAAIVASKLGLRALVWSAPGTLYLQKVLGVDPIGMKRMVTNVISERDPVPQTDVQQSAVQPIQCVGKGGSPQKGFVCHSMLKAGCEIWRICGDPKHRDFSASCGQWVGAEALKD